VAPAQPSPTIQQGLNGGLSWFNVCRCAGSDRSAALTPARPRRYARWQMVIAGATFPLWIGSGG
jgi:hypothetical protein